MVEPMLGDGAVLPPVPPGDGKFAENVLYFCRVLRRAGLKVGPQESLDAVAAIDAVGIGEKGEFKAALEAIFVKRREDLAVFDEAFRLFWRRRDLIEKMIAMMSPKAVSSQTKEKPKPAAARVRDALVAEQARPQAKEAPPEIETDARFTASGSEILRHTDFAQMTAAELALARRELSRMAMPFDKVATRRFQPSNRPPKIDPRASLRQAMKSGGDLMLPRFRKRRHMEPPLVVLADISGSMSQYTRIFLHFSHAMMERRRKMHVFLFGTRLSNVTRALRRRDPDEALAACTAAVSDWSGGTRIGETLTEFNRLWGRRVLGQGAVVLLLTDGLERDGVEELEREMDRLHRSCRRLIWVNPLLRFHGFEARARGVKVMLPHVDEFRPVHNLEAIGDLASVLSGATGRQSADPRRFLERTFP